MKKKYKIGDTAKAMVRNKFIALSLHIREKKYISNQWAALYL
jgi:hypothetical protein